MNLERAVEISVRAVCDIKSRTHPYIPTYHGDLWVMQDAPRKNPRKTEVFSLLPPDETVSKVRDLGLGWHFICAIHADEAGFDDLRTAYKDRGYRALATERFFVHDLKEIPAFDSDPPVRHVTSREQWAGINQVAAHPRKLRPPTRLYGIWDDQRDYGWVQSVPFEKEAWVSDLFVYSEYRSRGYGRALMSRLLRDDKDQGFDASVLVGSVAGSRIYPALGYGQIALMQIFCPARR